MDPPGINLGFHKYRLFPFDCIGDSISKIATPPDVDFVAAGPHFLEYDEGRK